MVLGLASDKLEYLNLFHFFLQCSVSGMPGVSLMVTDDPPEAMYYHTTATTCQLASTTE